MFFVTLSLFPGAIAEIRPSSKIWEDCKSEFTVLLLAIFNAFDLIGRFFPSLSCFEKYTPKVNDRSITNSFGHLLGYELSGLRYHIIFPTFARFLFYPIFVKSNINSVIRSDLIVGFFVALFGLSNGYIAVICFMFTPTMLVEESHKEASSILLLLSCYSGLVLGAFFGSGIIDKL